MKNKLIVLSGFVLGFAPVVALAAGTSCSLVAGTDAPTTLFSLFCRIGQILNAVLPVMITLAVVYFVWGVVSYMIGNDEEAKKRGKDKVIYGIIGLAIIVSVWGLVNILVDTFGLDMAEEANVPTVDF